MTACTKVTIETFQRHSSDVHEALRVIHTTHRSQ